MEHLEQLQYYFMRAMENSILKSIFSVICMAAQFLFGVFDKGLQVLLALILVDFLTGVAKSFKKYYEYDKSANLLSLKSLRIIRSRAMRDGLWKIMEYMAALFIANMLTLQAGTPIFRDFIIFWITFTELKSIIENFEIMGLEMPKGIDTIMDEFKNFLGGVLDE